MEVEVYCEFSFAADDDVTEMTETIFAQFDNTNYTIDHLYIDFGRTGHVANFALNMNTTGRLKLESITVWLFDIQDDIGQHLFTSTAFSNSKSSLRGIEIIPYYDQDLVFTFDPEFLGGLENLTDLNLIRYDYAAQPLPETIFKGLESFTLDAPLTNLTSTTFPTMPNLKFIYLSSLNISHIQKGFMDLFPVLEDFVITQSNIATIETGFFVNSSAKLEYVGLYSNMLTSVDLTGLSPNCIVELDYNSISRLEEENFRPFVEGIINNPEADGYINIPGNELECSCDVKWLIVDLKTPVVFRNAFCADDIALDQVDPDLLIIECPDSN